MLRDIIVEIIEIAGPVAVKALAVIAGIIAFAPLLIALLAPIFG